MGEDGQPAGTPTWIVLTVGRLILVLGMTFLLASPVLLAFAGHTVATGLAMLVIISVGMNGVRNLTDDDSDEPTIETDAMSPRAAFAFTTGVIIIGMCMFSLHLLVIAGGLALAATQLPQTPLVGGGLMIAAIVASHVDLWLADDDHMSLLVLGAAIGAKIANGLVLLLVQRGGGPSLDGRGVSRIFSGRPLIPFR